MRFQSLFTLALLGGLTGAVALSGESRADDAEGQLGGLTCNRISGTGINLLVFSSAQVRCIFKGSTGAQQWYDGKTGVALGVDLKWNVEETIFFGVLSSTVKFVPEGDFLSGRYGGAKADAALGVGVGAAVLLGGSNDTMALKPAVETSKGVGVAAGLSYLNLNPDPLNKARLITPHGSLFALALYTEYFDRAFKYYHRSVYAGSDYFSERAIAASGDIPPAPEETTKWQLSDAQRAEADAMRARLTAALKKTERARVHAAKAQVNFDCWLFAMGHAGEGENAVACRKALDTHLVKVETAIVEEVTEKTLMQPSWHTVLFATDKSDLDKYARQVVDGVLKRLDQVTDARVYVMGNTDMTGSSKYNLKLSEKRAESVTSALLAAGMPKQWFTPVVFGEHNPVSITRNPHNALNRRVDVVVEPKQIKPEAIKAGASRQMTK
jgi:outer membrane protein OmpA-like peptidoglycan-associated protein